MWGRRVKREMKENDVKVEMKTGDMEGKGGKGEGRRAKEDDEEKKIKERMTS